MIEISNLVSPSPEQWLFVIHGMRNPMNSWDKMDSYIDEYGRNGREFVLGERDLDLCRRLFLGGSEHRKYDRMLPILLDINAPLYWWKEFDTYDVGVTRPEDITENSCSTMHKIHSRPLKLEDFSVEHLTADNLAVTRHTIEAINEARKEFVKSKKKAEWWQMIQMLPSTYNQLRSVSINYEVAANMVRQRTGHKLDEWNEYVDYLLDNVPYLKEITNL